MAMQSPAEQLVGAVLNRRFRLVKLLGEGGMGAVYEADCAEGKRAVKVLHEEFKKMEEVRQRFFAEAQATQNLAHPNIVSVIESAVAEDGSPYMVMELLHGQSLGDRLDGGQTMSAEEAWPIMSQVLSALGAAHAARIVHRDLKPDNVFISKDPSGNDFVRLLDFGIAKIMDAAGGMGSKTRTGALIGTAGYMSPEQIKSAKSVDHRADLWAMGTMLYQMLTGALPFRGDDDFTRLTAVIVGSPVPIESIAPEHARFSAFFERAFAKDVNARYQTADEMTRALAAIMSANASQAAYGATSLAMPVMDVAPAAGAPRTSQQGTSIMQASAFVAPTGAAVSAPAGSMAVADTTPASANARPQLNPLTTTARAQYAPAGHTRVSGGADAVVAVVAPQVQVLHSPVPPGRTLPEESSARSGAPWWLVAVIAAVCLGIGFVAGFLAGGR
ncbi:MAG: protein kinase [Polyangiaceae bacterium]|nr:protein kinase [Polyangiaceae bacterium]